MSENGNGTSKAGKVKPKSYKCERCGKELETALDGWPAKKPRWCIDCIEAGMAWGMERFMEASE